MADANSKPTILSETKKALKSAAENQLHQAVITSGKNGEFRIDATLTGTAKDAAKAAIMNQTQQELCKAGYVVSLTCDSNAPGKASYYLDFSTEKGKERVVVGVAMDNDRAAYYLKKADGFRQDIFSKVKNWFD